MNFNPWSWTLSGMQWECWFKRQYMYEQIKLLIIYAIIWEIQVKKHDFNLQFENNKPAQNVNRCDISLIYVWTMIFTE